MMNNNNSRRTSLFGGIALVVLVVLGFCLPKMAEDVDNKKIVVCQFPWTGEMEYWTSPGIKWQGFGNTTEYYKTNQIWFNEIKKDDAGNVNPTGENPAMPITYNRQRQGLHSGQRAHRVAVGAQVSGAHPDALQRHGPIDKRAYPSHAGQSRYLLRSVDVFTRIG